jgi:hypothetical protein
MKHNMTAADRIIRVIIAVIIAILYFSNAIPPAWGITLMMVSFVFMLTAFLNFCPLYTLFGIRKWEKKSKVSPGNS